jgi:hypothetical protein
VVQSTFEDFQGDDEAYDVCVCGGALAKRVGIKGLLRCVECERSWNVVGLEQWR